MQQVLTRNFSRPSLTLSLPLALVTLLLIVTPITRAAHAADQGDDTIVAEYNGKTFTSQDLNDAVMRLNTRARRSLTDNKEKLQQFVENQIVTTLIYDDGRAKGYDKDPQIVEQLNEMKRHLVVQKVMQEQQASPVDDSLIRTYYDEHKQDFSGDRVKASHILVKDEALARKLYDEIVADPSKFESLAADNSTDRSNAKRGGDLGFFERGRMVKEFDTAAFALSEDGQVSEPVQTRFGWHIIKRTGREDGKQKTFDEVKNQIKVRLVSQQRRDLTQAYLDKLKADAGLKIHNEALDGIQLPAHAKKGDK